MAVRSALRRRRDPRPTRRDHQRTDAALVRHAQHRRGDGDPRRGEDPLRPGAVAAADARAPAGRGARPARAGRLPGPAAARAGRGGRRYGCPTRPRSRSSVRRCWASTPMRCSRRSVTPRSSARRCARAARPEARRAGCARSARRRAADAVQQLAQLVRLEGLDQVRVEAGPRASARCPGPVRSRSARPAACARHRVGRAVGAPAPARPCPAGRCRAARRRGDVRRPAASAPAPS